MEMRQTAASALADARRSSEASRQQTNFQASAIRRKPLPSADLLDSLPRKRVKTSPDRPNTVSFTTTPAHSKRASEDSSPTSSQPSKRTRLSKPRTREHSQDSFPISSTAPDRLHTFPPIRKPLSSNVASPTASEALTPDPIVEEDVDDIEAEVERRLARNEKRRRERMGETDRLNEVTSSVKRKRLSGGSTSSIESRSETVEASTINKKGRKRLKKRSGHASDEAKPTLQGKSKRPTTPERNPISENKGKRRISAIFDGVDEPSQDFETMDNESRRWRKRIALTSS